MNRFISILLAVMVTVSGAPAIPVAEPAQEIRLYQSYLQFILCRQVQQQATEIEAGSAADEVAKAVASWVAGQKTAIKAGLEEIWGSEAKREMADFVDRYNQAEAANDETYLMVLSGGRTPPAGENGYAWLRTVMFAGPLQATVSESSEFLAEIQTWLDVKTKSSTALPLEAWLQRDQQDFAWSPPRKVVRVGQPVNPLRAAEAEVAPFEEMDVDLVSPMSDYASQRDAKRKKALEEARTGMAQVAAERKAVEEELARQELAAARLEAEAVQRQARSLAQTEKEALDQRKNSWGNRLKRILGTTVSATGGAVLGGVGARAGSEAAGALFD